MVSTMDNTVILIATNRNNNFDNGVIPATLELFTSRLQERYRDDNHQPETFIITTDRPVTAYNSTCRRLSIPRQNIVDGYSSWYRIEDTEKGSPKSKKSFTTVHIGDELNCAHANSLDERVRKILDSPLQSRSQNKYIIFDSLTAVERTTSASRFMQSLQNILEEHRKQRPGSRITFITTFRTIASDNQSMKTMERLSDTVVRMEHAGWQPTSSRLGTKDQIIKFEVQSHKFSGRVQFETIHGCFNRESTNLQTIQVTNNGYDSKPTFSNPSDESELVSKLDQHGLSFRLSLSSKEREVRAKVGLSYQHQDHNVADKALELHPAHLQISGNNTLRDDSAYSSEDSEEEEMFSEDV